MRGGLDRGADPSARSASPREETFHAETRRTRRDASLSINGASQTRLANTSSISFHDRSSDAIVRALDAEGICVSAGAACHSGKVEPSATMKAMRKPASQAIGTVRFSLSRYTTAAEIDATIGAVQRVAAYSTIV